jgi:hypothetical protein
LADGASHVGKNDGTCWFKKDEPARDFKRLACFLESNTIKHQGIGDWGPFFESKKGTSSSR